MTLGPIVGLLRFASPASSPKVRERTLPLGGINPPRRELWGGVANLSWVFVIWGVCVPSSPSSP